MIIETRATSRGVRQRNEDMVRRWWLVVVGGAGGGGAHGGIKAAPMSSFSWTPLEQMTLRYR